jgi:polysaccharide deacetylase 2 family uncharacterized protein YibQ
MDGAGAAQRGERNLTIVVTDQCHSQQMGRNLLALQEQVSFAVAVGFWRPEEKG